MIKSEVLNRLKFLITRLGLSQKEFAKSVGVSSSNISDIFSQRIKKISPTLIELLKYKYNINPHWLLEGNGEMFVEVRKNSNLLSSNFLKLYKEENRQHLIKESEFLLHKEKLEKNQTNKTPKFEIQNSSKEEWVEVYELGKTAAGIPIEAANQWDGTTVKVLKKLIIGDVKKYYVLKVEGSSMIEKGINNKDYVLIRHQESADNGQIVVALIDGETTLKRFQIKENKISLLSGNKKLPKIEINQKDLKIRGIFVKKPW